jgi:hypothetical protein
LGLGQEHKFIIEKHFLTKLQGNSASENWGTGGINRGSIGKDINGGTSGRDGTQTNYDDKGNYIIMKFNFQLIKLKEKQK